MRLAEALEETATATLRRIADAHGLVHDDSSTRSELIGRIVERLTDAAYLEEQLDSLGADEHAVLGLARAHDAGEVRGMLADRDFPGAVDALAERGLLFRVFAAAGPMRGEVYIAPDELLERLPAPALEGGPPGLPVPPAAGERRASEPTFSLFCLASVLAGAHGRSGTGPARVEARLEAEVGAWSEEPGGWPWDARWQWLRHLGEASRLIVRGADGGVVVAASAPRLLDEPPALLERLWRAYLRDKAWSELAQIGHADGAELASTVALRAALVEIVRKLPRGAWIAFDELEDWLRRTRPNVVREQLTPRGVLSLEPLDWAALERPLLRYVLLGPLYWLGVISATVDGAAVMHRPLTERRDAEPCAWEADEEQDVLLAPPRTALGTLLRGERYLTLRERGRPSRYVLEQAPVAAALGSGGSLAECSQLLRRLTAGEALPARVAERLAGWERRFGAVGIRPAVLLEADAAADLDAALTEERVRGFVRQRLGPTTAEVAAADALELAAALRGSGHLPRVDAALRLAAESRQAYGGLVDERVLEFLLVALLALGTARPEQLAELEGAPSLRERLERQFPPERLAHLRAMAARLAGELPSGGAPRPARGRRPRRRAGRG